MKSDDSMAIQVEPKDVDSFQVLAATVGSLDQMMKIHSGKMPKRDLLSIVSERNKAAVKLEKFVADIYKRYNLDDSHLWAFDPARGEVFQLPQQRPIWRFK